MCFSATGSFAAASFLTFIGIVTLYKNHSPRHRLFVCIPLMFAIQQAAEGLVWLTITENRSSWIHHIGIYTFLLFAISIWPLYMPLALLLPEPNKLRKRLLYGLTFLGLLESAYTIMLFVTTPITASIASHSIHYDLTPALTNALNNNWIFFAFLLIYAIQTVGPFFITSMRTGYLIGSAFMSALAITLLFKFAAVASVWCFFAAILSILILGTLTQEQCKE